MTRMFSDVWIEQLAAFPAEPIRVFAIRHSHSLALQPLMRRRLFAMIFESRQYRCGLCIFDFLLRTNKLSPGLFNARNWRTIMHHGLGPLGKHRAEGLNWEPKFVPVSRKKLEVPGSM